jgi:dCMP deaminase
MIEIYGTTDPKDNWVEMLRHCYLAAAQSPDESTQNGALIHLDSYEVLTACNDFPPSVEITPKRLARPEKYFWIEHAERAAIFGALNEGVNLNGATLFCTWYACADCARAIIQSGIRNVVGHAAMRDGTPDHWKDSINAAFDMLEEANVKMYWVDEPILEAKPILFNGEIFDPSVP